MTTYDKIYEAKFSIVMTCHGESHEVSKYAWYSILKKSSSLSLATDENPVRIKPFGVFSCLDMTTCDKYSL